MFYIHSTQIRWLTPQLTSPHVSLAVSVSSRPSRAHHPEAASITQRRGKAGRAPTAWSGCSHDELHTLPGIRRAVPSVTTVGIPHNVSLLRTTAIATHNISQYIAADNIDRLVVQSIVPDYGYQYISHPVYCRRKTLLLSQFSNVRCYHSVYWAVPPSRRSLSQSDFGPEAPPRLHDGSHGRTR